MVDDIWYWAGDRSTDLTWYTKRASLAGIYTSAGLTKPCGDITRVTLTFLLELHMVQDTSNDFKETWGFLDRRMDDIATFAKYRGQVREREEERGGEGGREHVCV